MGKRWGIIAVVNLCVYSMLYSGTLFEDPFNTKDNWAKVSGNCTENLANGLFSIDATSLTMYKHSESFQDFTYSMKMKANFNIASPQHCAILFCFQANPIGYMFAVLPNNQYDIGNWTLSGTQISYSSLIQGGNINSFISAENNATHTLKVSKKGSDIYFFCNNVFLEKLTDNQYPAGDVGFAIGAGQKASFDHALVTDDIEIGKPLKYFSDDFEDGDLFGWRKLNGNGTATAKNGVMNVSSGTDAMILYTNGGYKDMPCTTIVEHKSGTSFYGIVFLKFHPNQSIPIYYYLINSSKQYSVFSSTAGDIISNSNIHGTKDTLIVTKDYDFIANGHVLDDTTFDAGLDFNGVGVIVYTGSSVIEFDNFRAGDYDSTGIIYEPNIIPLFTKARTSYLLGGSGIIYDIRGRKVASFQGGYKEKLKNLSSGSYFIVIPEGNKNHVVRRAIIKAR